IGAAPKKATYTCPMHPEIVQDHPGSCPKCGMALEPMEVTAEEDDSELHDMTRRLIIAAALSLPVLIVSMGPMIGLHFDHWLRSFSSWFQLALCSVVVLWAGWPFWVRGWRSIV